MCLDGLLVEGDHEVIACLSQFRHGLRGGAGDDPIVVVVLWVDGATERCLISEGGMYRLQWSWDLKMCPY